MNIEGIHLAHACICLILALYLAYIYYWEDRKIQRAHFMFYWIVACLIWSIYYFLKYTDLIGIKSTFDMWSVACDISISNINSIVILYAVASIKKNDLIINTYLVSGPTIALTINAFFIISFFTFVKDIKEAVYILSNGAAILSAFTLVFFYHYISQRIKTRVNRSFAIWLFVGYSFIQLEYPLLCISNEVKIINEHIIYMLALLFKILCIIFIIKTRREVISNPIPQGT